MSSPSSTSFKNVRLLTSVASPSSLYDVVCSSSGITSIVPAANPPFSVLSKEDHLPELFERTTISNDEHLNTEIDGAGSWLMPG